MKFKREDNGEIVEATYEQAINQDASGCIALEDGVKAKRCQSGSVEASPAQIVTKPIVSENLGVFDNSVEEYREDARQYGFTGVEFRKDPMFGKFYQCHVSSRGEWGRYVKHRGKVDQNKTSGNTLSAPEFDRAKQAVLREFGE